MTTSGPNQNKYYVSYVVQPGKPWGHAALLLRSTETNRGREKLKSTLYGFAGKYPYDDAQISSDNFDPSSPTIRNIEHHLSQYKTWEVSEAEFKSLTRNLDEAKVEQDTRLASKDKENKPLLFHPVTQNCKTFAVEHLTTIKSISPEDLQKLNNPFIPIPVFSGKLNKLKDITKICESLGKLDLMIDNKLDQKNLQRDQKDALEKYKEELESAKKNLNEMNTTLPVDKEAENIIKKEFEKLQTATDVCRKALAKTNIEPSIMSALKSLLEKLKEYLPFTLEGQMKKLPHPK